MENVYTWVNVYLHSHNIYDPEQLPLIPVSQYEFVDPLVYVLSPEFWSTRPKFLMEKLAPIDQEIQYAIGKIDPG